LRVATFNIRNGRALDRRSWWWFRRAELARHMRRLEADVWCLQEAYPSQVDYFCRSDFGEPRWTCISQGRNANGGGEAVPVLAKASVVVPVSNITRWFGPEPDKAGSRSPGATHPRIATIARYTQVASGLPLVVVNLHLDSASADRRRSSLEQLTEWVGADVADEPMIVLGDFNGSLDESGFGTLRALGLQSVLDEDAGPTSNGFGHGLADQKQIDHIFVSQHFVVTSAKVDRSTGHASDHYPVVADLSISFAGEHNSSRTSLPRSR
jgi:endonuclease/exonuclease/phosphatase family metal-dependent hydrolase